MTYTVLLLRDRDGGYVVRVPALRGCVTEGDNLAEALDNAREAIQAYVESLDLDGLPAPDDRPVSCEPYSEEELALIRRQTAEIDLPPELDAWFSQLAGCVKTSLEFDSRTDLERR